MGEHRGPVLPVGGGNVGRDIRGNAYAGRAWKYASGAGMSVKGLDWTVSWAVLTKTARTSTGGFTLQTETLHICLTAASSLLTADSMICA